jgi:peptidoglycan/xylan/chitin deacetylase (PgdA/CDA1 family)
MNRSPFCLSPARVALRLVLTLLPLLILLILGACSTPDGEPAAELPTALPQAALPAPDTENALSDAPVQPVAAAEEPVVAPAEALPSPTLAAPPLPTPAPTTAFVAVVDPPPTPEITPRAEFTATTEPSLPAEPLPTPPGVYSWTLKVPILMYHYISTPPEDADIYRVDLSVTEAAFAEQMAYLRDNGYTTIDLYDLSLAITNQIELPEKPIILTFDDGYLDNYQNAFPVLAANGQKGVFFVVTEFIDKNREGYLTWELVEEMAAAGMRFESHSRTHPDLTTLSRDGLIWELRGSQETLTAHIGYTPRYFCYPGGDYNDETIAMLQELDFWGATTTAGGSWHGFDDRFEWRRIRVRNDTSLAEFAQVTDLEGTVGGKTP